MSNKEIKTTAPVRAYMLGYYTSLQECGYALREIPLDKMSKKYRIQLKIKAKEAIEGSWLDRSVDNSKS